MRHSNALLDLESSFIYMYSVDYSEQVGTLFS